MEPIEYETSGEEYWKVLCPAELAQAFGLKSVEAELPAWHDVMAGQGRAWEIVRRLFRVFTIMDPEPDDLRAWTESEIAEKYGIAEALVQAELANAVKAWDIHRARANVRSGISVISEEELAHLTRFSSGDGMTEEEIARLLKAFGFDHIQKDPVLRAEVASRIISLKDWLNSPHTRAGARDLIRMELAMQTMDSLLVRDRNKLAALMAEEDQTAADHSDKIEEIRKRITSQETTMRQTSEAHAKKQEAIGANDLDMTARKRIYVETVTQLIDMCAEFERDPENYRPDGVFTANEIDWQLEPSGERGPQYRLDIVQVANESLLPENLWSSSYKPTKVTRRVCQELEQMYKMLRGVPKDAEPLPDREDDEEGDAAVLDVMTLPIGEAEAPVPMAAAAGEAPAAGFY